MNLSITSINALIPENCGAVVVYGRQDCHYGAVSEALRCQHTKTVFDYNLGYSNTQHRYSDKCHSVSRSFHKISTSGGFNSTCKAGLTNVVLENYRRKVEGLPIIPIIFCIDSNFGCFGEGPDSFNPAEVALRNRITDTEIRRAFKLCTEFDEKVTKVALETFKFVKVEKVKTTFFGQTHVELVQVDNPWDNQEWKEAWVKRTEQRKLQRGFSNWKAGAWRSQFKNKIKEIDETAHPSKKSSFNRSVLVTAALASVLCGAAASVFTMMPQVAEAA